MPSLGLQVALEAGPGWLLPKESCGKVGQAGQKTSKSAGWAGGVGGWLGGRDRAEALRGAVRSAQDSAKGSSPEETYQLGLSSELPSPDFCENLRGIIEGQGSVSLRRSA